MEQEATLSRVAMYVTRDCLVVPVQVELHDDLVLQMQRDILERVQKTGIKGIITDFSRVEIVDSFLGRVISDTAKMASLLGAKMVVTGLKPGVVASLIDLDFDLGDVPTAVALEEGFRLLQPVVSPEEELEEMEEAEVELEEAEEETAEDEEEDGSKGEY